MGEVFATVAPVFLCAAAGFAWARLGQPFDRESATALNAELAAPCLVFSRLVTLSLDAGAMARMAVAAACAMAVFAVLGALVLRALRLPRHTYLGPLVIANTGNMGIPICLFAFGDAGLPLAIAYFSVNAVANFTVGPPLWSGRWHPAEILRTPLVWAVLLAVGTLTFDWPLPGWLLAGAHLLGDLSIPLMLLSLGVALAQLRVVRVSHAFGMAVLRVAIGLGAGLALAPLFGFEGTAYGVFVLQSAMPAAIFNHLFAQRYDRSPDDVASIVVVSNLLAFLVLPALIAWVRASS